MADLSQPIAADPAKHRDELFQRLDALREKESFCDVTVAVKGKEFKAHKVVLAAASPFFLSLWESNMIESNEQLIEIKLEDATASIMEDVLQFIYSGNVTVTEENCHKLIATSDYLLLPGLKTLASSFLEDNLTIENCIFNYYFAEKYHCAELSEVSCKTIYANFTDVMETEDFLNLEMKQAMEWVSSDDIDVSDEEAIFTGIVKWVSHNRNERESCFPDLLRQVRIRSLSLEFILKKLLKEELVTRNNDCLNFVVESMESVFIAADKGLTKAPRKCQRVLVEAVFVCGGRKALCYLPDENKWYFIANIIFDHQHHAVLQYRDKLYIFSKQTFPDKQSQEKRYFEQSHVAEFYVPSTNTWGSIQTRLCYSDEKFSSLSVLNGFSSLYAVTESATSTMNGIFAYDVDNNEWALLGAEDEFIQDRWGACGIAAGCHLYIIGGTNKGDFPATGITKVERFDPKEHELEEVAPLTEARHDAFGAAMNGKIYVAGGIQMREQRCRLLNTCEVYDPSTNEWHLIADLCVPRHSASMVSFKGALYVIGGLKNTNNTSTLRELSVEMFDSETSEWKEKGSIPVSGESSEERYKQIHYKASFATIHEDVFTVENIISV